MQSIHVLTLCICMIDVWWSGAHAFCWLPSLYAKPSHHPFPAASRSSTFGSITVAWNSAYWSELINMKSRIDHFLPPALPLYPPPNLPSHPLSFRNSPFPWIIPHFSLFSHQNPGFHFGKQSHWPKGTQLMGGRPREGPGWSHKGPPHPVAPTR